MSYEKRNILRRTIGVAVFCYLFYQVAWHKEWFAVFGNQPLASAIFLVVLVVAIVFVGWLFGHSATMTSGQYRLRVGLAILLGLGCVWTYNFIVESVDWWFVLVIPLGIVGLVVLWAFTTWNDLPSRVPFFGKKATTTTSAPAPATVP